MRKEEQQELKALLCDLHTLSGFRLSIHDTEFREIEAYPEQLSSFCHLVQSSPSGSCQCVENDRRAFDYVRKNPGVYLYKCCFGLYEAVAPLYLMGNLVGYLMMGQTIDRDPHSLDEVFQAGLRCIKDRSLLKRTCDDICVCDKENILSCMKVLDICAQYITFSNRFPLRRSNIADRVKQYVDENYAHKITIEQICAGLFCSRTAVTKAFRHKFGIGINEYLTSVRVGAARRLLLNTPKPVSKIAECCGFSDQNYFCKVFLKECGLTPSAYRKSQNEPTAAS